MVKKSTGLILLGAIVFSCSTTWAQFVVIHVPYEMRTISSLDTAMVTWSDPYRNDPGKEYHVSIKSLFDDMFNEYTTQDTFLVIPPNLAPDENNLVIQIKPVKDSHRDNLILLRRKLIAPDSSDRIFDSETCSKYITKLLKLNMYATAYSTFQLYKEKYSLMFYSDFFKEADNRFYRDRGLRIVFKNDNPVLKDGMTGGAVHRDH